MALIDDFKSRFPEFSTSVVDTYIPILEDVWPCYYGGVYEDCGIEIILNLLAHMMTIETSSGSSNVQTTQSKSVGSVSVSYAQGFASSNMRDDWLRTTKYGLRYLMLTRKRQGAIFV